jgi:cytochrome c biogenesis protein CcmG/thiol:disulfide interchange protein DsbE
MADQAEPADQEPTEQGQATPAKGRRWLVALLPLVIFLVLAAIFMRQLMVGGNSRDIPSALIGKPIPQFELAPLEGLADGDGNQVPGLASAGFKGKVSIVNVWASWCAPCRQEHPLLMQLSKREGVRLVGINYKDQTANALRFLGQLGNPFAAIGIDPRGSAAIDWGVYGVPESFIVAADGTIAYKHVGPLSEKSLEEKFLPALEKVIGESAK